MVGIDCCTIPASTGQQCKQFNNSAQRNNSNATTRRSLAFYQINEGIPKLFYIVFMIFKILFSVFVKNRSIARDWIYIFLLLWIFIYIAQKNNEIKSYNWWICLMTYYTSRSKNYYLHLTYNYHVDIICLSEKLNIKIVLSLVYI